MLRRALIPHRAAAFHTGLSLGLASALVAHPPSTQASQGLSTDPHQRYERGKQLLSEGRYDDAAEVFRQAQIEIQQGGVELDRGITSDLEGFERPMGGEPAAPAEPNAVTGYTERARRELAQRNYLKALIQAQHALDLNPTDLEAKRLVEEAFGFLQMPGRPTPAAEQAARPLAGAPHEVTTGRGPPVWEVRGSPGRLQLRRKAGRQRFLRGPELQQTAWRRDLVEAYRISHGDVLEVFVWQHPDLSRDIIVRPDGRISFPLVGDLEAVGLSLTQLDAVLTERLKTYIRFPDVSLAMKRFGGTKTILMGEVGRPGIYVPAGEGRVLDVIAMAGGFTRQAGQGNIFLIRGGLASPQIAKLDLDLKRATRSGTLMDNIPLQSNDILFVPPGKVASVFQFLEQFYPAINAALVGTNVAEKFGYNFTGVGGGAPTSDD